MLEKNELLNKMLAHFPRWTDIRKRATKSVGGKVAATVAEETAMIQEAIADYKKDFFIEDYMGKEESILSLAYRIYIGGVTLSELKLVSPSYPVTKRLDLFLEESDYAYYEDGWLYVKDETEAITYTLNDYIYKEDTEVFHVWNVYDEFAAFVGLTRELYETNKELENRILNVFKDKQNSSGAGLTQALLTELINVDPTLSKEDIVIQGVTPSNLQKQYDEFTTVLDKLAEINKDVYRLKQWDIDTWTYPLKSIAYISHFWDVALEAYKNGIGKDEDLTVSIAKPTDKTDAIVRFYVRSQEKLVYYLIKQELLKTFRLNLSAHEDILNPYEGNYRIKASEIVDITDADIAFQVSDVKKDYDTISAHQFVKADNEELEAAGVKVTDTRQLTPGKRYVVSLSPDNILGDYYIKKLAYVSEGETHNLIQENANWISQHGELRYKGYSFFGNQTKHFIYADGVEDINNKATLMQGYNTMTLKAEINNAQNKRLYYAFGSSFKPILSDYVQTIGFDYNDTTKTYSSAVPSNHSQFTVSGKMNGLKLYVAGKAWVRTTINNGELNEYAITDNYVEIPIWHEPMDVQLEIISTSSTEQLEISDVRYTYFTTKISVAEGDFVTIDGSEYFPNIANNVLSIEVTAYSAGSPYLEYVIVGEPCTVDKAYVTQSFVAKAGDYVEMEASNSFFVELIPLDNANNYLKNDPSYVCQYNPSRRFEVLPGVSKARIELDLSDFVEITSIQPNAGKIKNYYGSYYIEIEANDCLETIFISGQRIIQATKERLVDIFKVNVEQGEKLYISNIFEGFAIHRGDQQEFIKLCEIEYYEGAFRNGLFEFINLPEHVIAAYEKGLQRNTDIDMGAARYSGRINNAYLHIKGGTTSIAYNKNFIFQEVKDDIEIIDTFKPFLDQNKRYMYLLENMTDAVKARFLNNCGNKAYECYALTRQTPIELSCNLDLMSPDSYSISKIDLDVDVLLSKVVSLKDTYALETGDSVQLQQYMIKAPEGVEVNYRTINHTATSIEEFPEMYGYEVIYMKDEHYNKLANCNIDEIIYIGTEPQIDNGSGNIPATAYTLMHEEGIIVWQNDFHIDAYSDIYVKYTLKKPVSLTIDDDLLYDIIETNSFGDQIDAYAHIKTKNDIYEMQNGDLLDLSEDIYFKEADRIVVDCSLPSFSGRKEEKGIRFVQEVEDNVISLKSGYYYFDGVEYYLFANETTDEVGQVGNTKFFNTIKENNFLYLKKTSNNYIKNSVLNLQGLGNIFNQNFESGNAVEGASSIKAITACNSFNHWQTVGMNLGFAEGLNDIGIKLMPLIADGYAVLDLTEGIFKNNKISLYATNDVKAYIGCCPKGEKETSLITLKEALHSVISEKDLLELTFADEGESYFLVVKGQGVIDDIILMDADKVNGKWQYHKKNIDTLGFDITEQRPDGYTQRLLLTRPEACSGEGAELVEDGYVVNSPYVEWNYTKAKEFSTETDWSTCQLNRLRVNNGFIEANVMDGELVTPAIYIGDNRMIRNVIIKINDLALEQMTGIRTCLLTSTDAEGNFTKLPSSMNNVLTVDAQKLMEYIKLSIDIPKDKVISSIKIYIEYISTDEAAPVESIMYNGKLTSQILDTYMTAKYELSDFVLDEISDEHHAEFFIRGAKENSESKVWTSWKPILLEDGKLMNKITFDGYRYFQLLISLKHKNAYVKLGHIDMKVVR